MDKTAEALKDRTKRFVVNVLEFAETLSRTPASDAIIRQLARAGVGVAGNYRSACRARSHVEFTARLGVVLEEADESELWLDVCETKGWGDGSQRTRLLAESRELLAIFSKAFATARNNDRACGRTSRQR
jgi:four helix bundle protein